MGMNTVPRATVDERRAAVVAGQPLPVGQCNNAMRCARIRGRLAVYFRGINRLIISSSRSHHAITPPPRAGGPPPPPSKRAGFSGRPHVRIARHNACAKQNTVRSSTG